MSEPNKKVIPLKPDTVPADKMLVMLTAGELRELISSILEQKGFNRTGEDRLVKIDEAATFLCVSEEWLYHNQKKLPFTRRLGRGLLRFSVAGMQKWIESKKALHATQLSIHFGYHERAGIAANEESLGHDAKRAGGGARSCEEHGGAGRAG